MEDRMSLSLPPELFRVFRSESVFFLAVHEAPDGDALGSALGLHIMLRKMGKESVLLFSREEVPQKYLFMAGMDEVAAEAHPDPQVDDAVFVALECPSTERISGYGEAAKRARILVNIDHHPDNRVYGDINVILPEAPSTTAIIMGLADDLGVVIDADTATCLYVGLVTDTGRFQYDNTTAEAFELAARLVTLGAEPHRVFQEIYERVGYGALRLLGVILARAEYLPNDRLIWSIIRQEDLNENGADMRDSESFIDFLRSVNGAQAAMLVKEHEEGRYRISLRSRGKVDVSRIAHLKGGGGHRNAAGFTMNASLPEVLEFVRREVGSQLRA